MPSLDWMPGTTRGMVVRCVAVKRRVKIRGSIVGFEVGVEVVCVVVQQEEVAVYMPIKYPG